MIKLKKLLIKEETEKIWQIEHSSGETVGFVKATSSGEALEKFYKHDRIPESDEREFQASESDQSEVNNFKQYWQKKSEATPWMADMAKRALQNVDIK